MGQKKATKVMGAAIDKIAESGAVAAAGTTVTAAVVAGPKEAACLKDGKVAGKG